MKDEVGGGASPIGGGGGGGGGGSQPPETGPDRPTAPGEVQRLRALLEDAESEIADLEARVAELEGELGAAREAGERAARDQAIERELTRAGAVDLEAAAMLLAASLGGEPGADIAAGVRDLRDRKPFLFAGPRKGTNAAMGPGVAPDELGEMASRARNSGDRAALLRYLRRRRST